MTGRGLLFSYKIHHTVDYQKRRPCRKGAGYGVYVG